MNSALMGAVLAGIGWAVWWPADEPTEPKPEVTIVEPVKRTRFKGGLIGSLRSATTDEEKLSLVREVANLSPKEIEEMLGETYPKRGATGDNFGVVAMLVAWGRVDPEAALEWGFSHLNDNGSGKWEWAWRAVGPEWAINDSEGFIQYVVSCFPKEGESIYSYLPRETGRPILHFGNEEFRWLLRADPKYFMQVNHQYAEWGSGIDEDFVESLSGEDDYEFVLSTWEDLSPETDRVFQKDLDEKRTKLKGLAEDDPERGRAQQEYDWAQLGRRMRIDPQENRLAQRVIRSWMEIDPEGFAESRFARWRKK